MNKGFEVIGKNPSPRPLTSAEQLTQTPEKIIAGSGEK
jgi:hypothetical protein